MANKMVEQKPITTHPIPGIEATIYTTAKVVYVVVNDNYFKRLEMLKLNEQLQRLA